MITLRFEIEQSENLKRGEIMDIADAVSLLNQAKEKKVLVIGDAILDEYIYGSVNRISTGIRIPVISEHNRSFCLGGAANIAANISGLSQRVFFISQLGEDEAATRIQELISCYKISGFFFSQGNTAIKRRIYVDGQQVIRHDTESSYHLNTSYLMTTLEQLKEFDIKLIIIADYCLGTITDIVLKTCIDFASSQDIPVFYTSRCPSPFAIGKVHCVIGNQSELQDILPTLDKQDYVMTVGENGFFFNKDGNKGSQSIQQVYPVNVSGAGDTVLSVISLLWEQNNSIENILELAAVAGRAAVISQETYVVKTSFLLSNFFEEQIHYQSSIKIQSLIQAKAITDAWKNGGKTIAFTNGCFDLLHFGHIQSLREMSLMADRLVVAINTDESVKKLKGDLRPINSLVERSLSLACLDMVDLIIPFSSETAVEVIREVQPDIYSKGEEYKNRTLLEAKYAKEVRFTQMVKDVSTTHLIERIENTIHYE